MEQTGRSRRRSAASLRSEPLGCRAIAVGPLQIASRLPDPEPVLLKTRLRNKPPRGWSFPIGCELLSQLLEGVPHYDELSVSFWSLAKTTPKGQQLEAMKSEACPVLGATYSRSERRLSSSHRMSELGWYDPQWDITIYAVPSIHRSLIRKLLLESRLGPLHGWLRKTVPETSQFERRALSVVFDPIASQLLFSGS
jgi:hypothetical protein